jgi:periplasmic protein TonB
MGKSILVGFGMEPGDTQTPVEQSKISEEASDSRGPSPDPKGGLSQIKDQSEQPMNSEPVLHFAGLDTVVEEPIWKTLWVGIQDALFPKKLPPLQLTSQPIAVVDRMAVKRSPASSALSFITHVIVVGLILLFAIEQWHTRMIQKKMTQTTLTNVPFMPATPLKDTMGGGGGGGNHETVEASKGKLPEMSKKPLAPPQILKLDNPKLPVTPAVLMPQQIKLPDAANMPNLGIPQSQQVALASQGGGSGSGFGTGSGGGIGSGNGNGIGPGEGGGYGGGLMHLGGGVSAPVLIYDPDPEFSDEARRAKYQGVCVVGLIVDAQGNPQQAHVVRPLGMGLDEKALEAVRQYKFKPAMFKGKPVPVEINIEVNFRIY